MNFLTLGEIIKMHGGVVQTGPFGSQLHQREYTTEGIPVIMPKDIIDGRIVKTSIARISESKASSLSRHTLSEGSIVFPRRGDISKRAYITSEDEGALCGTGCIKIEVPRNQLSARFLYYYLGLPSVVDWLERNATGTTMLNLNTSIMENVCIPMISLDKQTKIADVLFAYDELIENNRRRIELLEQAARLIYKEWFVDLRFPGHEQVKVIDGVPEGWEKAQVKSIITTVPRKKRVKREDYLLLGSIPCIDQSRDFIGGYTDDDDAVIDIGSPIIVFGDHTRVLKYVDFPFASGADGTQLIHAKCKGLSQQYLYFALDALDLSNYFYARHFKFLKNEYILIPNKKLITLFTGLGLALLEQMGHLREMNIKLAQARDLLLPRLMNGEISV
jgi:type I restriction enzyme S subunit